MHAGGAHDAEEEIDEAVIIVVVVVITWRRDASELSECSGWRVSRHVVLTGHRRTTQR